MRRSFIVTTTVVVLTLAASAATATAYFYDSSRSDMLAEGIVVAGVDVGGLRIDVARERLRQAVVAELERPLALTFRDRRFVVRPRRQGLAVDVDGMVARALAETRSGSLFHRVVRDLRGDRLALTIPLEASASSSSLDAVADRIARALDRSPRSAAVNASPIAVQIRPARFGREVRRDVLVRLLEQRILDPNAERTLQIPMRGVRPKVTTADLPRRYPAFITVSRSTFQLRLFRRLRLYKTYPIAVGQAGLETPAGLYRIDDKQVDPSWHVPNSPWAGDLAGRVIPPGPDDPLKARWLGFYNGAGIHGTDAIYSLGSAASHGCIRMSISDVIELYDLVPTGTPIYVG
jgi:lipoprotein-anchoring transpeptidase ErfK/SrfK